MNASPEGTGSGSPGRHWPALAGGALAILFLFSLYLALDRIYQVDEAQNIYMARVVALGQTQRFFTTGSIFLLGPLSWLARTATTSSGLFDGSRLLFLGVFWMNLSLIALCAGAPLRSRRFLILLLAAATLAPLWDYGFEVRHDNLVLTILLAQWWILRRSKLSPAPAYFCLGALSVFMQFIAFKALLYWIPLSAAAIFFPPARLQTSSRARLAATFMLGVLAAFLVGRLLYALSGSWDSYLNGVRTSIGHSENPGRFSPLSTVNRVFAQSPLLAGAAMGALFAMGWKLWKDGLRSLSWEGEAPEALLFLGTTLVLLINPVPYPYNLVLVVPFGFLAAARWVAGQQDWPATPSAWAMAAGMFLFAHATPFLIQTLRHLDYTNARQKELMELAESLTDPASDRVFDASGLVACRESISYQWFLHTLVMEKLRDGRLPPVREMILHQPPSVILTSYRTDWLDEADKAFIAAHYLPYSDDCLVLGSALPAGGGTFQCLHGGRYVLLLDGGKGLPAPDAAQVDQRTAPSGGALELQAGSHQVVAPAGTRPVLAWVGPKLQGPPRIAQSPHQRTFINWY